MAAVKLAGLSIIHGDQRSLLRLYPGIAQFEREGACFRVGITVIKGTELVVYAKTRSRIRFEVRRNGRGRYTSLARSVGLARHPSDRLLGIIFAIERDDAISRIAWPDFFSRFNEPDQSTVADLIEVIGQVVRATDGSDAQVRSLLAKLIMDGGICLSIDEGVTDQAVQRLSRAGLLKPVELRRRRPADQHRRYELADDYRWLRENLEASFVTSNDDAFSASETE